VKRLNGPKRYLKKSKKISTTTVHNYLKKTHWGREAYKSPIKSLLSAKNVEDRKKFGEMLKSQGYLDPGRLGREKRDGIFFTDESWIELTRRTTRFRTDQKSEVPPLLKPKNGLKFMVASGFCSRGVSELHVVPKGQTITGEYYRNKNCPFTSMLWTIRNCSPTKEKFHFNKMVHHPTPQRQQWHFWIVDLSRCGERGCGPEIARTSTLLRICGPFLRIRHSRNQNPLI